MASLQQVVDGLRSLNKKNKELINIINEITGNTDETIFKGVDTFVEVLENKEPILQDKTVTENGEIVADDGYDGLGTVTVNVVEDLSNISNLLGDDIEDTKSDIESSISDLIDLANTTTGNTDTNLTDSVNALIGGFGQGGSSKDMTFSENSSHIMIGNQIRLSSENIVDDVELIFVTTENSSLELQIE